MQTKTFDTAMAEIARRIRDMREIAGYSVEEMARHTDTTPAQYAEYEAGKGDLPFSFLHKCSVVFGIDITAILEGHTAKLSSYAVTRKGEGQLVVGENGMEIRNLAPRFRNKLAEPHWVRYEYSSAEQNKPIHTTTHSGQEFDYVLRGRLKVQVGSHTEILSPGDCIYYNSSTPHGMIAVDGEACEFCAIVLTGAETQPESAVQTIVTARSSQHLLCEKFVKCTEDENGGLQKVAFENADTYNFAFDTVDALAEAYPQKLAMVHLDRERRERRFTFADMRAMSNRTANYFRALGIRPGDRVMLVLKRRYQFWICMLALHKLGAVAIPATHQLQTHDLEYRFNAAGVSAIVAVGDNGLADAVDEAAALCPTVKTKLLVGGKREGWHDFDEEYPLYTGKFARTEDTPCGNAISTMFFTSGTTGYPKLAMHSYKYALGHFVTAKYWHGIEQDGLHLTISDTGWGKALWGKFYGQWMSEGAVFAYDFDRFDAADLLPLFAKYHITTFCAPPTMLRMFIKEDLAGYDFSTVRRMTTAGEALNPEVFRQIKKATGLQVMEGYGQTETTLVIATLPGTPSKPGAMGKASPLYDVALLDADGKPVPMGETGEICIRTEEHIPCGLFAGYYHDEEMTKQAWHDGYYHTGDTAWCDEDGYFWYVGRVDDLIKSSGYRIGPFEIENVIMELPYVLECGVSAAPDALRGQVVKASIVLTRGTVPTDALKKEIQDYVKHHTAPYKYPRVIVFRESLPKTISGKIQRNQL